MSDTQYKDIINLSRPVSKRHTPMSLQDRAAQFAPFAALSGFEEGIKETARKTSSKIELDDNEKNLINDKLLLVAEKLPENPIITVEYFVADARKEGGSYFTKTAQVRKIDLFDRSIIFADSVKIYIADLIRLDLKF